MYQRSDDDTGRGSELHCVTFQKGEIQPFENEREATEDEFGLKIDLEHRIYVDSIGIYNAYGANAGLKNSCC